MNKLKGFLTVGLFAFALTISSFASAEDLNPPQQVIQETSDLLHDILQKDKSKLDDLDYVFSWSTKYLNLVLI